MKEQLKRWNQLAGTNKAENIQENSLSRIPGQDLYGNQFMKELLNENLADALADAGDSDKEADEEADEEAESAESDIGAEEDEDGEAKTTASDLRQSFKQSADDISKAIPSKTRDEFVDMFNVVKDVAASGDKAKMKKIADKIASIV